MDSLRVDGTSSSAHRESGDRPVALNRVGSVSAARLTPLLNSALTGQVVKNVIYCDPMVFLVIFPCMLVPPLGVHLYEKHVAPELRRKLQLKKLAEEGDAPQQATSPSSASQPSVAPVSQVKAQHTIGGSVQKAQFEWTWPSAWAAVRTTLSFSMPEWLVGPSDSWETVLTGVRDVVVEEKTYLAHRRFLPVFSTVAYLLAGLLALFIFAEDAQFTLKDSLWYAIRMYVMTAASFAAVCSVHSRGNIAGYKKVQSTREQLLAGLRMKYISIPRDTTPAATTTATTSELTPIVENDHSSPEPSLPSPPAVHNRSSSSVLDNATALAASTNQPILEKTTALHLLKGIDSLSKLDKASHVERRMVFVALVALVRGLIGWYSAWCGGSGATTCFLYGVFHTVVGFLFFGLAVQIEFELHEDDRRWSVFTAISSEQKCRARAIPFYAPLASLGRSQNIVGWYAIRGFLKDLKGRFDFCRMETMLAMILGQIVSVAGVGLYWNYFHLGLGALVVYENVIGNNLLVAFDTFLCLSIILDMMKEAVLINKICSGHAKLVLDEEVNRAFALSGAEVPHAEGGQRGVVDSIHQLTALREKLVQVKEDEKLCIFGLKLDDTILTYIRGALVSYGIVFAQRMWTKKVLKDQH